MICNLSYPITESMPIYSGNAELNLISAKDIEKGDSHLGFICGLPCSFFGQEPKGG